MKVVTVHHVRLPLQRALTTHQLPPAVRVLSLDCLLAERVTDSVEDLLHLHVQRLVAVNAEVLVSGRFLTASRARHGRRRLDSRLFTDLDTMHRRVRLLLGLPAELRHVSRDHRRPTRASLTVLDERLGLSTRRQPVRVRLPEIRGRHRLLHTSTLRGLSETLEESLVTDSFGRRQLRPQEVVTVARMLRQPLRDVRHRRDQVDVVLTTLSVNADFDRMLTITHVTDTQVEQFAATEPTLELEPDERSVPRIPSGINHLLDVLVEIEHVGLVGLRLVVPARLRRNPLVRVRDGIATSDVLGEHTECDPVIPVRFLRAILDVVRVVNPSDDGLRGVLGVVEPVGILVDTTPQDGVVETDISVLANPRIVAQELLVSMMTVLLPPQPEFVRELQQEVSVSFAAATLAGLEFIAECFDGLLRVSHTTEHIDSAGKPLVESPPPASTHSFTIPQTSSSGATVEVAA